MVLIWKIAHLRVAAFNPVQVKQGEGRSWEDNDQGQSRRQAFSERLAVGFVSRCPLQDRRVYVPIG